MKIKIKHPSEDWFKWFAWYPVKAGDYWVWWEIVQKRHWYGNGWKFTDYKIN